jgi:hypothetical protein
MTTVVARYPVLASAIAIGIVVAIANLVGGGSSASAGASLAIVWAWGLGVTILGRRSETISVLAGRPVDERWEHINLEACAWALGISAVVVLAAFVVAEATGGAWQPYAFMASVIAASYLGSLVVVRIRH